MKNELTINDAAKINESVAVKNANEYAAQKAAEKAAEKKYANLKP